ncbi:interleukin-1 receptor accessory protein-like 1-B isoform X2 [Fopius arisanus]|uniref:Soluble interferon alpha/beta receptor OPG204 n=1 Tax=Fopius arisanus TaxID=64838 RepID=A0A9R1T1V4_9HYME|nr:PREDICTED: interleukin-1 receptor accessory protein-like 1-B isoform X2 [Fopius arisanus]
MGLLRDMGLLMIIFVMRGFWIVAGGPPPARDNELEEYCSAHKFDNLPGGLRFTKEVVTTEYANVGSFKAIHCCLRGYRSIEWYKDDRAYPWPGAVSHFILYPESANQTIYTQEARPSDAGRYSCKARNDTNTLIGDISLEIVGEDTSGYTGKPLVSYKPVSQLVSLGGAARLFCEAYLGKVDLPDARNSVTWTKAGSNATVPSQGRVSQHRVTREDEQIIGSYLEITATTLEDYGQYECRVSNGADEEMTLSAHIYLHDERYAVGLRNGSWRKAMMLGVVVFVLVVSMIASYIRCWLPLAVLWRNRFSRLEENDGKNCDALVCYHEKDAFIALGALVATLENKYHFKCTTLELSHLNRNWNMEIAPHAASARRVIILLSPSSIPQPWTEGNLSLVLKQISQLPLKSIVVSLSDLPNITTFAKTGSCVDAASDGIVLDKMTILRWHEKERENSSDTKFWYRLRLLLPVVRPLTKKSDESRCQSVAMIIQSNGTNTLQMKSRSQGSFEVLV